MLEPFDRGVHKSSHSHIHIIGIICRTFHLDYSADTSISPPTPDFIIWGMKCALPASKWCDLWDRVYNFRRLKHVFLLHVWSARCFRSARGLFYFLLCDILDRLCQTLCNIFFRLKEWYALLISYVQTIALSTNFLKHIQFF